MFWCWLITDSFAQSPPAVYGMTTFWIGRSIPSSQLKLSTLKPVINADLKLKHSWKKKYTEENVTTWIVSEKWQTENTCATYRRLRALLAGMVEKRREIQTGESINAWTSNSGEYENHKKRDPSHKNSPSILKRERRIEISIRLRVWADDRLLWRCNSTSFYALCSPQRQVASFTVRWFLSIDRSITSLKYSRIFKFVVSPWRMREPQRHGTAGKEFTKNVVKKERRKERK